MSTYEINVLDLPSSSICKTYLSFNKLIAMFICHTVLYFIDVIVNLQSGVSAVTEGSDYLANITVEPTDLEANVDVIVQTYSCGADCKISLYPYT